LAVKMRLSRVGGKKNPIYRVVVADSRMPRDGRFIEVVGRYNPQTEPSLVEIDQEKALKWLANGAQPTQSVEKLLRIAGVRKEFEENKKSSKAG
jgi:small subunit ribosomal protein S16